MKKELLRQLPKIDDLLNLDKVIDQISSFGRIAVTDALRNRIEKYRNLILNDSIENFSIEEIINETIYDLKESKLPKLRGVINGTGIIVHTNLGRSILAEAALKSMIQVSKSYSNLEYSLIEGRRGSRYSHVEQLIKKITGAEAAMVVNNNAAAVMLVLNTLCKGKEAIVSRGQLVEIGGSFRVPDVLSFSGATLVEVGTTNRTHIYDYEDHINENTGVLLKVHTSNFKILGFTEEVSNEQLVEVGRKYGVPVVEDIGSGVLVDFSKYGLTYEPTVQESVKKDVDIITFSGDKMLGGPQSGIIVGKSSYIDRIKKNQLTRALRIDKLTLAALEGTLKLYLDEKQAVEEIPTLDMILSPKDIYRKRANKLKKKLDKLNLKINVQVKEDFSMVGGGAMPTEKLDTYVISVKSEDLSAQLIERELRLFSTPIIARVNNGEVLLDLRTILDNEIDTIVDAFKSIGEKSQ